MGVKVRGESAEETVMVEPRCPSCAARVPADADWCSLCYASLRVQPIPALLAAQPAPAYASSSSYDPLNAPASALAELSALAGSTTGLAAAVPVGTAPVATGRHARRQAAALAAAQAAGVPESGSGAAATWPCRKCAAQVPLEQNSCPVCGGAFLDAAEAPLRLPLIGDPKDLEGGRKAMVIVGGALAIIVAFLAIAMIIGLVL